MSAHEAPDRHDLTAADMDLFLHDAKRAPHNVETCTVAACWVCLAWHREEKAAVDTWAEIDREAS